MNRVWLLTKKIIGWILLVLFLLFVLLLIAVEGFDRYVATERGAKWFYKNIPYRTIEIKYTPSKVRYLSIGDPEKPALLLIHGAPGSIMDFRSFAKRDKLYEKYRLLIVERPGYGGTRPRKAEESILIQTKRIAEILEPETQPAVVLGHSYGGPIAVILGALIPEKIEKIIGVSGQYDPDNEIIFGISHWIKYGIFKYLMPHMVWASNVEKLSHPTALRELRSVYPEVVVKTILIHGDADTLVPYENSPFLLQLLPEAAEAELITLEGKDHPIHMSEVDYLVDFVYEL